VTGSAENVVAFAAAGEHFFGDGEGHDVAGIIAHFAGVEIGVVVELAAGDRAFDWGAFGTVVSVEIAAGERVLAGLDLHV
jgi:hypothetical protein